MNSGRLSVAKPSSSGFGLLWNAKRDELWVLRRAIARQQPVASSGLHFQPTIANVRSVTAIAGSRTQQWYHPNAIMQLAKRVVKQRMSRDTLTHYDSAVPILCVGRSPSARMRTGTRYASV